MNVQISVRAHYDPKVGCHVLPFPKTSELGVARSYQSLQIQQMGMLGPLTFANATNDAVFITSGLQFDEGDGIYINKLQYVQFPAGIQTINVLDTAVAAGDAPLILQATTAGGLGPTVAATLVNLKKTLWVTNVGASVFLHA